MKTVFTAVLAMALLVPAERLFAHGFSLSVNTDVSGKPTSVTAASNQPVLDQDTDPNDPNGPDNLFLDTFFIQTGGSNSGGQGTFEGGPQIVGPAPPWTNAYFTVLSPLYYSDGTGTAAAPATNGTYLQLYDLEVGAYPGATNGVANLTGTAATTPGFGISVQYYHEIEKDLHLALVSSQTNGEYGFAFDVTIPFIDGVTLTTGPLVEVFATGTSDDPNSTASTGFGLEPDAQQDAATLQVYDSVMAAVPEPSTTVLAAAGAMLLGMIRFRRFTKRR